MNEARAAVLETLSRATSQDASTLKPAEHQLKQWEIEPGFYSVLLSIFSNHDIDVNVRWLAVLYFKNGVDRYWRRTAPNAISEEEKEQLRERLIANMEEPVQQVATQLAVLIAKIARLDCPRSWPQLIPRLLDTVKVPNQWLQQRALLTLHHVTKTLSSKRLAGDRQLFRELTSSIFSFTLQLWDSHTSKFLELFSQKEQQAEMFLELSLLTLKILRKLMVHGFKEPENCPEASVFINLVFERLTQMLQFRTSMANHNSSKLKVEKIILNLTKVLLDSQSMYPAFFVGYLENSLQFCTTYVFTEAGNDLLFESFTVNCMNLIKAIVKCDAYRPAKAIEDTKEQYTIEAYKIKMKFFTCSTLTEISRRLVAHYFLLTEEELYLWENDPEDFAIDERGESWKFQLRPCTEVLFLSLLHEFRETISPLLVQMIRVIQQEVGGRVGPAHTGANLYREAVYNAAGIASYELFDEINFDDWFANHLINELKVIHPSYKFIRRRITWLIGQWIGVKLSSSKRPLVYRTLLDLLLPSEDLVVRLTAAQTLKIAIDDFEFKTEQFLPHLETTFSLLFQLLKETSECDTKMHVLHVLSFIIERMEHKIRPYVSTLVQYLPSLWDESHDHNMLRCAILTTLNHLVQGLGSTSVDLYPFLLPVIHYSTDVSQPPHVYLLEDGIALWLETVENASAMSPQLLHLFSNMPSLMDIGSENIKTCLNIISAYVLLGSKEFLERYCNEVVNICMNLLNEDVRAEGMVLVLRVIDNIFRMFPVEAPQLFWQLLPHIFDSILHKESIPMIMTMHLSIIGRLVVHNQTQFFAILDELSNQWQKKNEDLLGILIEVWCDRVDMVTQTERRKLSALSLGSFLSMNISAVTDHFHHIINACVQVLHDVCRNDSGTSFDYLVITEREELQDEFECEHDKRKRQLSLIDPVHCISLKEFMVSRLAECKQVYGAAQFPSLMSKVEPEIIQQLQDMLK